MKRFLFTICAFVLIAISALSLAACTNTDGAEYFNSIYQKHQNLAANATTYDRDDKQQKSFLIKGAAAQRNNYVTVDLGAEKAFNTITLQENGENVMLFSIYASAERDTGYQFLYQGDTIECGRVCYVGDVSYRYLRIFVVQTSDDYKVEQLGVYSVKHAKTEGLRNTAYLVMSDVDEDYDLSTLDAFTDIILFGSASFTAEGNIVYSTKDGYDNGETYQKKLDIIKRKIGDRSVRLLGDVYLNTKIAVDVLSVNRANSLLSIKAYIERFGLDGYDIDYEYPQNKTEWAAYNGFLQSFDAAMPNKILSVATSQYFLKLDPETVKAIDRLQYMLYDDFDKHGYQSTFPYMVNGVKKLLDIGFRADQIEVGVPTYSRPTDGWEFWGNYSDYADKLGRFDNLVFDNTFDHQGKPLTTPQYFNSYQMILDKTAFALDAGLGGIMMFRIGCDASYDHPLCLAKAVVEAKEAKRA